MYDKAKDIFEKKEIEYVNTQGNMHIFQALSHSKDAMGYLVMCELLTDKTMKWDCECWAFKISVEDETTPKICKHIQAAKYLFPTLGLRIVYNERV
tara:strand:- start:17 stop:304 length:288 start_codon:yes stop_codon:yes gene_type:complete